MERKQTCVKMVAAAFEHIVDRFNVHKSTWPGRTPVHHVVYMLFKNNSKIGMVLI